MTQDRSGLKLSHERGAFAGIQWIVVSYQECKIHVLYTSAMDTGTSAMHSITGPFTSD